MTDLMFERQYAPHVLHCRISPWAARKHMLAQVAAAEQTFLRTDPAEAHLLSSTVGRGIPAVVTIQVQFLLLCWLCKTHLSLSFPKFHLIPSCQPAGLQPERASGAWYVLGSSRHLPCCFLLRLNCRTVWPLSATEPAPLAHTLYLHLISLKWLKQTFLIKC